MAEDAKGPMPMRQAVVSYECGTGRRRRPVAKVQKRKVAAGAEAGVEKAKPERKAQPVAGSKAPKTDKAAASNGSRAE
jgi:hypothetical protein